MTSDDGSSASFNSVESICSIISLNDGTDESGFPKIGVLILSDNKSKTETVVRSLAFHLGLTGVKNICWWHDIVRKEASVATIEDEHTDALLSQTVKAATKIIFLVTNNLMEDKFAVDVFVRTFEICFEEEKLDPFIFVGDGSDLGGRLLADHLEKSLEEHLFKQILEALYSLIVFEQMEPYLSSFALKATQKIDNLRTYSIFPYNYMHNFYAPESVRLSDIKRTASIAVKKAENVHESITKAITDFAGEALGKKVDFFSRKIETFVESDKDSDKILVLNSRCEIMSLLITAAIETLFDISPKKSEYADLYDLSHTMSFTNLSLLNFRPESLRSLTSSGRYLIFYEFDRNIEGSLRVTNCLKTILSYFCYYFPIFESEMFDLLNTMREKFDRELIETQPYLLFELFVQVFEVHDVVKKIKRQIGSKSGGSNRLVIFLEGYYWLAPEEKVLFQSFICEKLLNLSPGFVKIIIANDYMVEKVSGLDTKLKRIDFISSESDHRKLIMLQCNARLTNVRQIVLSQIKQFDSNDDEVFQRDAQLSVSDESQYVDVLTRIEETIERDLKSMESLDQFYGCFVSLLKLALNLVAGPPKKKRKNKSSTNQQSFKLKNLISILVVSRDYIPYSLIQTIVVPSKNLLHGYVSELLELLLQICFTLLKVPKEATYAKSNLQLLASNMGIQKYLLENYDRCVKNGHNLLSKYSIDYLIGSDLQLDKTLKRKSVGNLVVKESMSRFLMRNIFYHLAASEIKNNDQRIGLLNVVLSDFDFLLKFLMSADQENINDLEELINKTIEETNDDEFLIFDITTVFAFIIHSRDFIKNNPEEIFNQILFRFNLDSLLAAVKEKDMNMPELVTSSLVTVARERNRFLNKEHVLIKDKSAEVFLPYYPGYSHTLKMETESSFSFDLNVLANLSKVAADVSHFGKSGIVQSSVLNLECDGGRHQVTLVFVNNDKLIVFDARTNEILNITPVNPEREPRKGSKAGLIPTSIMLPVYMVVGMCPLDQTAYILLRQHKAAKFFRFEHRNNLDNLLNIEFVLGPETLVALVRVKFPEIMELEDLGQPLSVKLIGKNSALLLEFQLFVLVLKYGELVKSAEREKGTEDNPLEVVIDDSKFHSVLFGVFQKPPQSSGLLIFNPLFNFQRKRSKKLLTGDFLCAQALHVNLVKTYALDGTETNSVESEDYEFAPSEKVSSMFLFRMGNSMDSFLCTGMSSGHIFVWNLSRRELTGNFKAHDGAVVKIIDFDLNQIKEFSNQGQNASYDLLVSSSADSTIKIFDKKNFHCLKTFSYSRFCCLDFSLAYSLTDADSTILRISVIDASGFLHISTFFAFELFFHDNDQRHKFASDFRRQSTKRNELESASRRDGKAPSKRKPSPQTGKTRPKKESFLDFSDLWANVRDVFGAGKKDDVLAVKQKRKNSATRSLYEVVARESGQFNRGSFVSINFRRNRQRNIHRVDGSIDSLFSLFSTPNDIEAEISKLGFGRMSDATKQESSVKQLPRSSHQVTCLAVRPDSGLVTFAGRSAELLVRSVKYGLTMNINTPEYFRKINDFEMVFSMFAKARASEKKHGSAEFAREVYFGEYGHMAPIYCVVFSPDTKFLATGCSKGRVCIWDCHADFILVAQYSHASSITSLAFDLKCQHLASGSADQVIKVWTLVGDDVLKAHVKVLKENPRTQRRSVRFSVITADDIDEGAVEALDEDSDPLPRTPPPVRKAKSMKRKYRRRTEGVGLRRKRGYRKRISVSPALLYKDDSDMVDPNEEKQRSAAEKLQYNQHHFVTKVDADPTVVLQGPLTKCTTILECNGSIKSLSFASDSSMLAATASSHYGCMRLWSLDHGYVEDDFVTLVRTVHRPVFNDQMPTVIFFSSDGKYLICGCEQSSRVENSHLILVFEVKQLAHGKVTLHRMKYLYAPGVPRYVYLGLSIDNKFLAEVVAGQPIKYWDLANKVVVKPKVVSEKQRRESYLSAASEATESDIALKEFRKSKYSRVEKEKSAVPAAELVLAETRFQLHSQAGVDSAMQSYPSLNSFINGTLAPFSGSKSSSKLQIVRDTVLGGRNKEDYVVDTFDGEFSIVKEGTNVHIFKNLNPVG